MIWDLEEWICALLADGIVSEKEHAAEVANLEKRADELEREVDDLKRKETSTS